MALNLESLISLLELEVSKIGRVCVSDGSGNDFLLMDTLLLSSSRNSIFELLKSNQEDIGLYALSLSDSFLINPDYEMEDDESLVQRDIKVDNSCLPLKVASIVEFFAGPSNKEFLVGFVLYSEDKRDSISIFTETDEIEILDNVSFLHRMNNLPFYYQTLVLHWYGV